MSITANFPAIRPTLNLDFANNRTVDPRITFTRASTATYFDRLGVLRTAAANEPRIDFDPATGVCRGLLIEEQRTNLAPYSNDFTNWSYKRFVTLQTGAVALDGSVATKLVCDTTANSEHFIDHLTTLGDGTYTQSVFVKPAEFTFVRLRPVHIGATQGPSTTILFNLAAGTVVTPVPSYASAGIIPVGNGWYRCWVTVTVSGVTGTVGPRIQLDNGSNSHIFTGDGTSGVYIWGAQFEQGGFPTSYIPTNGTQVTRSADSAVMTGANFSSWYRQDEGTFATVSQFGGTGVGGATRIIQVDDNSETARLVMVDTSTQLRVVATAASVAQADYSVVSAATIRRSSFGYKLNDIQSASNGTLGAGDTSCTIPTVNTMRIGSATGGAFGQIWIGRIAYWPKRLPNNQLQALTA